MFVINGDLGLKMKPIMITLLYLTTFGEIKLDTFENIHLVLAGSIKM